MSSKKAKRKSAPRRAGDLSPTRVAGESLVGDVTLVSAPLPVVSQSGEKLLIPLSSGLEGCGAHQEFSQSELLDYECELGSSVDPQASLAEVSHSSYGPRDSAKVTGVSLSSTRPQLSVSQHTGGTLSFAARAPVMASRVAGVVTQVSHRLSTVSTAQACSMFTSAPESTAVFSGIPGLGVSASLPGTGYHGIGDTMLTQHLHPPLGSGFPAPGVPSTKPDNHFPGLQPDSMSGVSSVHNQPWGPGFPYQPQAGVGSASGGGFPSNRVSDSGFPGVTPYGGYPFGFPTPYPYGFGFPMATPGISGQGNFAYGQSLPHPGFGQLPGFPGMHQPHPGFSPDNSMQRPSQGPTPARSRRRHRRVSVGVSNPPNSSPIVTASTSGVSAPLSVVSSVSEDSDSQSSHRSVRSDSSESVSDRFSLHAEQEEVDALSGGGHIPTPVPRPVSTEQPLDEACSVPPKPTSEASSLRAEILRLLGPDLCPPLRAPLREARSSALQQRLHQPSENFSERSLPEGNLISSALGHLQVLRSGHGPVQDDPSVGEALPSVGNYLSISHIGGFKPSNYAVHDNSISAQPVRLEDNFDSILSSVGTDQVVLSGKDRQN